MYGEKLIDFLVCVVNPAITGNVKNNNDLVCTVKDL